jgi:GxxExxY protein
MQDGIHASLTEKILGCAIEVHLVVDDAVIVEVKAIERLHLIHTAQMLTYLRVTGLRVGLVLNFNSPILMQGVRRIAL